MTCKYCIGYKFCSRGRNGQTNFYGKENACNNVEEVCQDFKNKDDFVEVVRCINCKHRMFSDMYIECKKRLEIVSPNHFCSYGERRAEE